MVSKRDEYVSEQTVGRIVDALNRVDERLRGLEGEVKLLAYKVDAAVADSQNALHRAADTNGRVRHMEQMHEEDHKAHVEAQKHFAEHLAESQPLMDSIQTLLAMAQAERAKKWVHQRGGMFLRLVVLVGGAVAAVGTIGAAAWTIMRNTVVK